MKKTARQIAYDVLSKVAGKKAKSKEDKKVEPDKKAKSKEDKKVEPDKKGKSKKDDFAASLDVPAEDDLFGGDVNLEQKKETPEVPKETPVTPEAPKNVINVEPEFRRGRAGVGLIDPTVQKKQELAADQARANSVRERLTQPSGAIRGVGDEDFEVVGKKFTPPTVAAKTIPKPKSVPLPPGPAAVSVGEGDFQVASGEKLPKLKEKVGPPPFPKLTGKKQ